MEDLATKSRVWWSKRLRGHQELPAGFIWLLFLEGVYNCPSGRREQLGEKGGHGEWSFTHLERKVGTVGVSSGQHCLLFWPLSNAGLVPI